MKPPRCQAMEELRAILTKMGEMEGARLALRGQLRTFPKRLARELNSTDQRLEAARYLYWFIPDLSAQDIAEGLLGVDVDELLQRIGTITIEVVCDRCKQPMECRSREEMKNVLRDARSRRL